MKFKIGDVVTRVNSFGGVLKVCDFTGPDHSICYRCTEEGHPGDITVWIPEDNLTLLPTEKTMFQVGDFVKAVKNSSSHNYPMNEKLRIRSVGDGGNRYTCEVVSAGYGVSRPNITTDELAKWVDMPEERPGFTREYFDAVLAGLKKLRGVQLETIQTTDAMIAEAAAKAAFMVRYELDVLDETVYKVYQALEGGLESCCTLELAKRVAEKLKA